MSLQERVQILRIKERQSVLEQIVELTENLKENGIELEELLADGGYSSGEAIWHLHQKTSTPTSPNFGQYKSGREKVLCSTKKKTIINAQNPKVSKPN